MTKCNYRMSRRAILAGVVTAAISAPAAAQTYPARQITILVPFAAGSVTDTTARAIGANLQEALGQTVVVENRPGAHGMLAATALMKAKPDGYTFLITTNSTHSAIALFKSVPYDPIKDFTPVARLGSFHSFVAVNPNTPIKTMQELVAHAKANPGKLSCAYGNSTGNITCEAIRLRNKIETVSVAYRSNPTAITDLVAGHVPMMIPDFGTGMPQVRAGKIRPLAVLTRDRNPLLDVPTLHETVMPGYDLLAWAGMFAPAGLPPEIAEKVSGALEKFLSQPETQERMLKSGVQVFYTGPKEFTAYVKSELTKWTDLIKEVGIQPQ